LPPDIKSFDVIICGAGPAGSTCTLALADSGLRVALLDKATFPRDKVCGDAVASYIPRVLGSIHPKLEAAFGEFEEKYPVDTYRLFAPNGRFVDVTSKNEGFISKRLHLDNFLLELAIAQSNVSYFPDHNVTQVTINAAANEAMVITPQGVFSARLVIGCDGANSVMARQLRREQLDPNHHSAAVRAYYSNVRGFSDRTFELHFMKGVLPGYFWLFPLKDNLVNVGLGASSAFISRNKINLRDALKKTISETPSISDRFRDAEMVGEIKGFGLPLGSRKVTISGDHFMLCGDAASLIDPLSGEGIGQAIVSGRYAGWHAARCFEANDFSAAFIKGYDQQVYDKFWRRNYKSYLMQRHIMTKPWLINGLVTAAAKNRIIHKMLANALA